MIVGATLALASGVTFGLNIAAIRRGVLSADVRQAMTITVMLGVPCFAIACLLSGGSRALAAMEPPALAWMSAAGIVHFIGGRFSDYSATQALGAALSTPIQQCSVAVSLALAMVFLGESFTLLKLVGLCLMLSGPIALMGRRRSHAAIAQNRSFRPAYGRGMFWGAMCALCYGTSPLLIVFGLGAERNVATALAGGLVSNLAAAVVVCGIIAWSGGLPWLRRFDQTAGRFFVISGLLVALSQMLLYAALALATVSVVVPLQRLSVMFRVIFSSLLNRQSEIFDRTLFIALALSTVGAIAISLESEAMRHTLPDAAATVLLAPWPHVD